MSSSNDTIFKTKVLPIMDKVMKDLRQKQVAELEKHTDSFSFLAAGAAGPDGGSAAQSAYVDRLRYTGKWNSKHTEDYINMVKAELKKQKIKVTPEMEKMMIDKMIKDSIPKSSIEYILKKGATSTIFYLPQALNKSKMENHIDDQAEKRYKPKGWEKGAGWALGAATDYLTTGGLGGTWKGAAKFVGVDLAINAVSEKMADDVPIVIAPEHREEYKKQQKKKEQAPAPQKKEENKPEPKQEKQEDTKEEEKPKEETEQKSEENAQPLQTNQNGWAGLLQSFGLNGIGDVGHNLGYVLAMLPDLLVGLFTGKTRMNMKDNLLPIASIAAGMFIKNPILKMMLIGLGGANLLNKAGHEVIEDHQKENVGPAQSRYRQYEDQPLNPRITNPELRGNCLVATIDKVPCTISLSPTVIDAYNQGALPLNTLANAILQKNDQMRQMAEQNYRSSEVQQSSSERYEEGRQTVVRPLAQR